MTAPHQDLFFESVGAYALGALDAADSRAFEAHLSTCAECRRELADLQRVTAGLGAAADPVAPPASLKEKTMARAIAQSQVAPRRASYGWLALAASVALAAAGTYAWSLRSQLQDLTHTVAELSDRANTLRNNLDDARRESARLSHVVDIVQAPNTILVSLSGTKDAPHAAGRAYFNPARGLVVSAEQMPALRPGRAYQLWMVMGPKPISAGVFTVSTAGAVTFVATVPPGTNIPAGAAVTFAVTEEPAGGSDGPTSAILIAGELKPR